MKHRHHQTAAVRYLKNYVNRSNKEIRFFLSYDAQNMDAILHDIRKSHEHEMTVRRAKIGLEKPKSFNPQGTIPEKCWQLFLICPA